MNNRTAVVFGATGLVGTYLVEELIRNMRYTAIKVFTRKKLNIEHIKVIEHIVDVENVESYKDEIRGNDLFICIGSTLRKAGSVKRFVEIDRDLPLVIARAAFDKELERVALVSAIGANSDSRHYYNRTKGEVEQGIIDIGFKQTISARPAMLLGKRNEFRILDPIAKGMMVLLSFLMIGKARKYKAIHGRDVAAAMIYALSENSDKVFYRSDELKFWADSTKEKLQDE